MSVFTPDVPGDPATSLDEPALVSFGSAPTAESRNSFVSEKKRPLAAFRKIGSSARRALSLVVRSTEQCAASSGCSEEHELVRSVQDISEEASRASSCPPLIAQICQSSLSGQETLSLSSASGSTERRGESPRQLENVGNHVRPNACCTQQPMTPATPARARSLLSALLKRHSSSALADKEPSSGAPRGPSPKPAPQCGDRNVLRSLARSHSGGLSPPPPGSAPSPHQPSPLSRSLAVRQGPDPPGLHPVLTPRRQHPADNARAVDGQAGDLCRSAPPGPSHPLRAAVQAAGAGRAVTSTTSASASAATTTPATGIAQSLLAAASAATAPAVVPVASDARRARPGWLTQLLGSPADVGTPDVTTPSPPQHRVGLSTVLSAANSPAGNLATVLLSPSSKPQRQLSPSSACGNPQAHGNLEEGPGLCRHGLGPLQPQAVAAQSVLLATSCCTPVSMLRGTWFLEDYSLQRRLYKGKMSSVYKGRCRRSGLPVALKVYFKARVPSNVIHMIMREVSIHLQASEHRSVLKLYGVFQTEELLVLVMELAGHGSLSDLCRISAGGRLDEAQVRQLVLDPLLDVLSYLHGMGVCHRDIKPENLLFASDWGFRLADFGVSINLMEERAVTRAGTADYMAPEVERCPLKSLPEENKDDVSLAYTTAVDVWTVGVLAYELLVGFPPIVVADSNGQSTSSSRLSFPASVSPGARDFISSALAQRPEERPTVRQLRHHPWILSAGVV